MLYDSKQKKKRPLRKKWRRKAPAGKMKASAKRTELPLVRFQAEQEKKCKEKDDSCPRRRQATSAKARKLNCIEQNCSVHQESETEGKSMCGGSKERRAPPPL